MLQKADEELIHGCVSSKIHAHKYTLAYAYIQLMAHPPSYFDRTQTIFTHEQMMARLAQRCSHSRSEVGESPKEKSMLQWERAVIGSTSRKTVCGRYSCSKVTSEGKTTYELWKANPTPGGSPMVRLHHGLDNFLQAQKLAQQDADR